MEPIIRSGDQLVIVRDDLDQLLGAIARRGFRLIGPTVRDGAIVYDDIASSADLPAGWTDEQDGGTYRLRRRDDGRVIEPVSAVALDGRCLRAKCEDDPRLGFELMRRFATLATGRLQSARLRLLDVYGTTHATSC